MNKECWLWHLNFKRWLVAGSVLWHWKPHWAFNRRFLSSATPRSPREMNRGRGATDTCVHHRKVKMPHRQTVTHGFLNSEMKSTRWRRHMKKERSVWHLNVMRWLVAGSMLWHWKPHWAFNRRFLLSVTTTSRQVTVHYMTYRHTQWPQ